MQLRIAVKNFIQNSDHPNVVQFRTNYEENAATINNESWDQYWTKMTQDKVWADYIFIQSTAWFLKHDIMIITTSNNDDNPIITISGNIDDENTPCPYATLTIGCKSNVHYQSLLPIESFHLNGISHSIKKPEATYSKDDPKPGLSVSQHDEKLKADTKSKEAEKIFKYETKNTEILFPILSDGIMKCYNCHKPFKLIVQHIKRSKDCSSIIDIDDLKSKLAIFYNTTAAERKAKSRKVQKEKDPAGFNATAAKAVAKSSQIRREKDPAGFKADAAQRKAMSTQILKEKDPAAFNAAAAKKVAKSSQIRKEKDPKGFKADVAQRKAESSQIMKEKIL